MRAIASLIVVATGCLFLEPARAENSACPGIFRFPADVIACSDRPVATLHAEMDELYTKALVETKDSARHSLVNEQEAWLEDRGTNCGVPIITWVTDADRQCTQ